MGHLYINIFHNILHFLHIAYDKQLLTVADELQKFLVHNKKIYNIIHRASKLTDTIGHNRCLF